MDLRQIKYFLTIAEEQTITKAAEKLHISQPPLSMALMELEEELGCTLMIRGKRHITLTTEGLALKRRGEQLLTLTEMTKSEISQIKDGINGTLYLGHVDSNGPALAARWIRDFCKKYPLVTYNLWCGTVDDLTDRLNSGLLDVAITMSPSNHDRLDSIQVYSEGWVAMIPADHSLAKKRKKSILPADIINDRLIISSRHSREEEIRRWFYDLEDEPHFIIKTAHSSSAIKLVTEGIGIALFPASVARNLPTDSGVVIKDIPCATKIDYLLSWDKERTMNSLTKTFIEYVRETGSENKLYIS